MAAIATVAAIVKNISDLVAIAVVAAILEKKKKKKHLGHSCLAD